MRRFYHRALSFVLISCLTWIPSSPACASIPAPQLDGTFNENALQGRLSFFLQSPLNKIVAVGILAKTIPIVVASQSHPIVGRGTGSLFLFFIGAGALAATFNMFGSPSDEIQRKSEEFHTQMSELERRINEAVCLEDLPGESELRTLQSQLYLLARDPRLGEHIRRLTELTFLLAYKKPPFMLLPSKKFALSNQGTFLELTDQMERWIHDAASRLREVLPKTPEQLAHWPTEIDRLIHTDYSRLETLLPHHRNESFDYDTRRKRDRLAGEPDGAPHHILIDFYLDALSEVEAIPLSPEAAGQLVLDFASFYFLSLWWMRIWDGGPEHLQANRERGERLLDQLQTGDASSGMRFIRHSSSIFRFPLSQFVTNERNLVARIERILDLYDDEPLVNPVALWLAHDHGRHLRPVIASVLEEHQDSESDVILQWLYEHRSFRNSVDYAFSVLARVSLFKSWTTLKARGRSLTPVEEEAFSAIASALIDWGDPEVELSELLLNQLNQDTSERSYVLAHSEPGPKTIIKFYPHELPQEILHAYFAYVDQHRDELLRILSGLTERFSEAGGFVYAPQGRYDVLSSSLLINLTLTAMLHPEHIGVYAFEDFDKISFDLFHLLWIGDTNHTSKLMHDGNTQPWFLRNVIGSMLAVLQFLADPVQHSPLESALRRGEERRASLQKRSA